MKSRDRLMQNAAVATGNGVSIEVNDLSNLAMQVSGTFSGTVTFETTVDETNWVSVQVINVTDGTVSTTVTAPGVYLCGVAGLTKVRARVSAWVSGSITVRGFAVDIQSGQPVADIDVDVLTVNSVAPQFDDTDKQAVSIYGKETAAGDMAIVTNPIGVLVSMDIKHWHLHKGRLFTAHIDNTVTNIGEMTVIAFNMPATGSFHLSTNAYSSHAADLNFYEDTSIDVDEGVDLVPVNRDRNAGITTTLTTIKTVPEAGKVTYYLEAAAAAANITTTTELDHEIIIGGEGPRALGASGGDDFGFELGLSKQYAVILTAGTNDDATHHLTVNWCEYVG